MKILNNGNRAFLVSKESVLKGGELTLDKKNKAINPGDTVEVTAECGKFLRTYKDIKVIEEKEKGK